MTEGLLVTENVPVLVIDAVEVTGGVKVALAVIVFVSEGVCVTVWVIVPVFVIVIDDERLLDCEALTDQLSVPDFDMLLVAVKVTGPAEVLRLAVMVSVSVVDGEKLTDCVREPVVILAVKLGLSVSLALGVMVTKTPVVELFPDTRKVVLELTVALAEADAINDSLVVAEGVRKTDTSAELIADRDKDADPESLLGERLNVGVGPAPSFGCATSCEIRLTFFFAQGPMDGELR